MNGEFQVIVQGVLKTYQRYEDIPLVIDNVIKFAPEIIPEPHTEEQHEIMESYNDKLKELMTRERM